MTMVASTQTWNLWQEVGALEEIGTGKMAVRKVTTGEAGTGDMRGVKEAVTKTEDTLEMEEVGRGAATGAGMLEAKTGEWEEIQVTTGGEMEKGQGKERGMIQGGQGVALLRQGAEKKEVKEDLEEELKGMEGEICLAGCKV